MLNNEDDNTLQVSEESRSQQHDADSGNDGSSNEILQKEKLIDPGNEHQHHDDTNEQRQRHDADAGSEATGSTGPEPGEGENDEPDTSGEAG